MKSLLVYITPEKKFSPECGTMIKVHIDNNYSLGYKKEDLLLVTNWDYEYNGVKSIVVGGEHFCAVRPRSIKTIILPALYDAGILKEGTIYWDHDFDAYQLNTIEDSELGLEGFDLGLTDYGWKPRWCLGSSFVKKGSKDIFQKVKELVVQNVEDEAAMVSLTRNPDINKRCKRLNITYNLGMRNVEINYNNATKPLKVLHFHPVYRGIKLLDIFMYGRNSLGIPLMPGRLINVFKQHGIQ